MPLLLPRVREGVRDAVAERVKSVSGEDGGKPFLVVALAMPFYADVTREGDLARATLDAGGRPVELTMQRAGERWKLVTIKDDELASRLAARLAPSLPAAAPSPPPQPEGRKPRGKPAR